MRAPALALLSVLSLLLAGCVTLPTEPSAADVDAATTPALQGLRALVADLPCEVDAVGEDTSANLLEISNLAYDGSTHGEIDARGDWLLAARYQLGGFEIANLADPQNPRLVDAFEWEGTGYDVKWMPDGETAVVGNREGIALVDVAPAMRGEGEPRLLSTWTYPSPKTFTNMHMLHTHRIDGGDFVFLAPNDDTGVWILRLTGEGDARALEHVTHTGPILGGGPLGPHDMWVGDDAKLGKPILYVANGFEGWLAWDVSDPANPQLLGGQPNLGAAQAYTHTIIGKWVGDRRLVVTIAEVGVNVLKVYDATDLRTPVLLAEWWAEKTAPQKPQHNLQLVNGTLYVAHYGNGVYAFDLTTLGDLFATNRLTPVAHYAPPEPAQEDTLGFSNVWDVLVHRGIVYVNDMERGTAAVAYGCLTPGDATATSDA